MPASVYVHVPFCVVKCGYCDFNSYATAEAEAHDRFLAALDQELSLRPRTEPPETVFIGGGTPTYLDEARFERLFEILDRHLQLGQRTEVSIEANPESVTAAKARAAFAGGVRRVSIGVQTFDPERLRWLDRAHGAEDVARAVDAFRAAGFENLSLDLMFGIPGQKLADWQRDLDQALAHEPDHLSCYNLTFEPGTRLTKEMERGNTGPNDDAEDRDMLLATRSTLAAAGFDAYEISNFAGRGGPCRHNDHYWLQGDYLGFGPGAASHVDGWRTTNLKPLDAWATAVERGLPASGEAELLTAFQRVGEALWLGLRRTDGVDTTPIRERTGLDPLRVHAAAIAHWQEQRMLKVDGSVLRLTTDGVVLADTLTTSFL